MLDQAERLRQLVEEGFSKDDKKPDDSAKIITITSGKGGVGKSNLVVNLAIILAKMGKKVLIFDADMGMGNDDILMGFLPKYNVYDIIYRGISVEEVVIEGPYGVKLLPGGTGMTKVEELAKYQRDNFLNKLTSMRGFDYILMDTGAGVSRSVLSFISCCDELIVVLTPEPTALTDAYSLLKAVKHFKLKKEAHIVVNKILDEKEGIETFEKFEGACTKFLNMNMKCMGSIPEDRAVVQAVREQVPFVVSHPESGAARSIEIIASRLSGMSTKEGSMGVQGLFKKIFNIFS